MGREGRGGGSIDSQLREDLERLKFVGGEGGGWEGQSTVNLGSDFATLQGLPLGVLILGGVNRQSTQRGSAERLKFVGGEGVDQQST